jgi:hypothetical protein
VNRAVHLYGSWQISGPRENFQLEFHADAKESMSCSYYYLMLFFFLVFFAPFVADTPS